VDFVALIVAIASIFGGGTVTPDDQPKIHVNSSFLNVGSNTYNA
jgi:hypothetical protein